MYSQIADVYEIWSGNDPAGPTCAAFYLSECMGTCGPILEIGVGTGRISRQLASAGLNVVGIDTSSEMLKICKEKMRETPGSLSLIKGDILEFESDTQFARILLPMRTIGHFITYELKKRLFMKINKLLAPDGKFIFDHFIFNTDAAILRNNLVEWVAEGRRNGTQYHLWHSYRWGLEEQILKSLLIVEQFDAQGVSVDRRAVPYEISVITPYEVNQLLNQTQMELVASYGTFDRGSLGHESKDQVYVCQKR